MVQPRAPRGDKIGGPHHGRRQRLHDRRLQVGNRLETGMLVGTTLKVHARPPRLA